MAGTLVVAPHPDDETIGCGGMLLREVAAGRSTHWVIVTDMLDGFSSEARDKREREIAEASQRLGFETVQRLGFPAAGLDSSHLRDLSKALSAAVAQVEPDTVLLPFAGDVHSDHRVVFDAGAAATKWFRSPSVGLLACYEAPSETDFAVHPDRRGFEPTLFVDVTDHLETKLEIMALYESEVHPHPFPRSEDAVRSLALVRGSAAGFAAAEAFQVLRQRVS